jgi:hypothetical protein
MSDPFRLLGNTRGSKRSVQELSLTDFVWLPAGDSLLKAELAKGRLQGLMEGIKTLELSAVIAALNANGPHLVQEDWATQFPVAKQLFDAYVEQTGETIAGQEVDRLYDVHMEMDIPEEVLYREMSFAQRAGAKECALAQLQKGTLGEYVFADPMYSVSFFCDVLATIFVANEELVCDQLGVSYGDFPQHMWEMWIDRAVHDWDNWVTLLCEGVLIYLSE